uniref:Uncharacterized protein n=1 Tax=Meloidogyne enterolobii TaxID=390850 RepID=A0A6V7V489_MELEN|nr:unnamed protein product [Meloidogyne enterolobii]
MSDLQVSYLQVSGSANVGSANVGSASVGSANIISASVATRKKYFKNDLNFYIELYRVTTLADMTFADPTLADPTFADPTFADPDTCRYDTCRSDICRSDFCRLDPFRSLLYLTYTPWNVCCNGGILGCYLIDDRNRIMLRAQSPATVDPPQGACRKTPREARGFAQAPRRRSIGLRWTFWTSGKKRISGKKSGSV